MTTIEAFSSTRRSAFLRSASLTDETKKRLLRRLLSTSRTREAVSNNCGSRVVSLRMSSISISYRDEAVRRSSPNKCDV